MSKRTRGIALVLVVVAATAVFGITQRVRTAHASSTFYTVCLLSAPNTANPPCLKLPSGATMGSTELILGASDYTDTGEQWFMASQGQVKTISPAVFNDGTFGSYYKDDYVYYIEKKDGTGHDGCAGVNTNTFYLIWVSCSDSTAKWVYSDGGLATGYGGYFVNVYETNRTDHKWIMSEDYTSNTGCDYFVGARVRVTPQGSTNNCEVQWTFAQFS